MKEKKEGGERRGEKKERERERERQKKKVPQQGSNPRPFTLQPTAWRVDSHVHTIHVYIANFDFDDPTVAALTAFAPPNTGPAGAPAAHAA